MTLTQLTYIINLHQLRVIVTLVFQKLSPHFWGNIYKGYTQNNATWHTSKKTWIIRVVYCSEQRLWKEYSLVIDRKFGSTCEERLSSFGLFMEWSSLPSMTFSIGFILGVGFLSLVRWNKPHPKKIVTSMIYRIAKENSMHLACSHQIEGPNQLSHRQTWSQMMQT